jgi:hypothetical protein
MTTGRIDQVDPVNWPRQPFTPRLHRFWTGSVSCGSPCLRKWLLLVLLVFGMEMNSESPRNRHGCFGGRTSGVRTHHRTGAHDFAGADEAWQACLRFDRVLEDDKAFGVHFLLAGAQCRVGDGDWWIVDVSCDEDNDVILMAGWPTSSLLNLACVTPIQPNAEDVWNAPGTSGGSRPCWSAFKAVFPVAMSQKVCCEAEVAVVLDCFFQCLDRMITCSWKVGRGGGCFCFADRLLAWMVKSD